MTFNTASTGKTQVSFDAYIIRLYQFEKNKPQRLLGIVETLGSAEKKAFTGYDELWKIINSSKLGGTEHRKDSKNNKKSHLKEGGEHEKGT